MKILEKLCDSLCMNEDEVIKFASTAPHRYKVYKIAKRNSSDTRTIAHPSKELKFVQRLLIKELEEVLKIHDCAFAYREGRSIKDNALLHLNSRYLLKMDFKNFFPSITPNLFFKILKEYGVIIDSKDKKILQGLLFWRPVRKGALVLSIGAPTSPMISNFIMHTFDEVVDKECKSRNVTYTRYADDLTFSTMVKNILFSIPDLISKNIKEITNNKITIHENKTIFSSKAHNRHVTGVTLTNDAKLSIGRKRKRIISSMIHKFSHNLLPEDEVVRLQGLLSHAKYIEPDFYSRMIRKYGLEVINNIKK